MKDKSLEMLEFPRVIEILAGYTGFAVSREMALALKPSHDYAHVSRMLKQSAEARHLLSIEPDVSIGGIYRYPRSGGAGGARENAGTSDPGGCAEDFDRHPLFA